MTLLSNETLLRLQGPDARRFLQGQTTANFEAAAPETTLRGAFCDPKGRILGDFLAAIVAPDEVLLRLRTPVAEALMTHLQKFLVFSKATLTRLDWQIGGRAENSSGNAVQRLGEVLRVPRGAGLTEYWSPVKDCPAELDDTAFHGREIALGEARIEAQTIGRYLPQDLNYDLNGAVSFEKGCYTGQEIVARLHYRGTPKRRLHRALLSESQVVTPGTSVFIGDAQQSAGSVVNFGTHPLGTALLLETVEGALAQGLRLADSATVLQAWPITD